MRICFAGQDRPTYYRAQAARVSVDGDERYLCLSDYGVKITLDPDEVAHIMMVFGAIATSFTPPMPAVRPAVTAGSMDSGEADRVFQLRAVHRVVRAMNDGACPKCGAIGDRDIMTCHDSADLYCSYCGFRVTAQETRDAMRQFAPVMAESVRIFEEWRAGRTAPVERSENVPQTAVVRVCNSQGHAP